VSKVAVIIRSLAIIVTLVFLVGCFGNRSAKACKKPREYQEARSIPDLQVPDDLDAPNPDTGLTIPDAPPNAPSGKEQDDSGAPCLDTPPDFFDTSPV